MHLLIDGQALQTSSSKQRGIGRYSSNLLRAMAEARPSWQIRVVQNGILPPIAAADLYGLPVLSFRPPLGGDILYRDFNERYYADWLTAQGADGVLLLSPCEGWEAIVPAFCGARPRVFGIAYDLIPLLYPEQYLSDLGSARWYAHRFRHLLRCDALLAISEATAHDVRTLGGEEAPLVVNIGGAVDPLFAPLAPAELAARARQVRKRFDLHREFILYVGAPDYRKNLQGAIRAFGALPRDCREPLDLAIVCRANPAERAAITATAKQCGVASALRLICSADDQDLRALYQVCRLFFLPSLYEGLGLPVLEALCCGAPVATSDCSALPEYAGSASWLGDPTSPESMARMLQAALAEPRDERRAERQDFAQTFSWCRVGERACAVLERFLQARHQKRSRPRRLGWVTPLTPESFGLIEYARDVMPWLAERFDIELITTPGQTVVPGDLARRFLILSSPEMPARQAAQPYDMLLYHLPPTGAPAGVMEMLQQFPGGVVLHDLPMEVLASLAQSKLPKDAEMLVHSAEAWRQARRCLNVSVVYLPRYDDPHRLASAYADWIDLAICRQEESDGHWRAFAVQSLAECQNEAVAVIDTWAKLRVLGQRHCLRDAECRMQQAS
jgi:glycosyltransferase involved in cell wall biosynthesis